MAVSAQIGQSAAGHDARGLALSCFDSKAIFAAEQGIWRLISFFGNPLDEFDAALTLAPDFVMAHVMRADFCLLQSERSFLSDAANSLQQAASHNAHANVRERQHVAASRLCLEGKWEEACLAWDAIVTDYPHDILALFNAHIMDFYRGDSLNLRRRLTGVLPFWSKNDPLYSYVLGMHAFGLEECNFYAQAEDTGRRALELEKRDPWSVHAVTHVMEMQGRIDDGIDWLTSRMGDWAPDNGLAFHNWWHLALFNLERGDYAAALEVFDTRIGVPTPAMSLQLVDATALLWRLHLLGADVGNRWHAIAQAWANRDKLERGYYAFNDIHALLALIGAGRMEEAEDFHSNEGVVTGTNAMMVRDVGRPLIPAMIAFAKGQNEKAANQLLAVRSCASRMGGSHAQRDLIEQTLLVAAIRAGNKALAERMANERLLTKPHSPLARRWLNEARAALPLAS
ncbi:MAG: tetratricopeptide repeat protein [Burkholderiales bacterium]